MGAWIAEWSLRSTFEHWYAMPWAVSLRFGDDNSFRTQAQHLRIISDTTLFVCQIWHWIVKQIKENKRNLFLKTLQNWF